MTEKPIYAVIYARVSTDSEEQAGSIPTQLARCRSYCAAVNWQIVEECYDQGISGTTLDRPGWKRVEQLVKSGKVNMVLATSLDRLARTDQFMGWLREVLHPAGADFATIGERIDTSSASGRLALGILVQIAQFQAEQTREKTSAAMQYRAEQGLWVTRIPFGTMQGDVKGVPVKDPETWPWVEYFFEQAAAGKPHSEILEALSQKGLRSPSGAEFGQTTLARVISNRFYLGYVPYKNQEFRAKHDCLIPEDLWRRAQNKTLRKVGRRPAAAAYLLRGKVVTDQLEIIEPLDLLGKPLPLVPYYSHGRSKQYPSYLRSDKRRKFGGLKARIVDLSATRWLLSSVPANELDKAVVDSLARLADADTRQVLLARAEGAAERMRQEASETKLRREEELAIVRQKIKKLVSMSIRQGDEASPRLVHKWNTELEVLELSEQELIGQVQACSDIAYRLEQASLEAEATLEQVNCIREFWDSGDIVNLRKVIDLLVEKVIVRASEKQYEVRVRLRPLPVVREVFETLPIMEEAAPTVVIRILGELRLSGLARRGWPICQGAL